MISGVPASFYDGRTAKRHDVTVSLSNDRQFLIIKGDTIGSTSIGWRLSDLRALSDQVNQDQLTVTSYADTDDEAPLDPARLVITDPQIIDVIIRTRPNLFKKDLRKGTYTNITKKVGFAVGALALMIFVIIPNLANLMAPLVPRDKEVAFGKSVVAQVRMLLGNRGEDFFCENPAGVAALNTMVARLTGPQDMEYDLNVQVVDHEMLNAFAAPGGQIIIMRGLIDKSKTADAVAGVLAHEIGHVEHRDPLRGALRSAGTAGLLSIAIGDVTGGVIIAAAADFVLNSSYTREAEAKADDYAIEMVQMAQVSAEGLATFFDFVAELLGEEGIDLPEILSSHPDTVGRAAKARAGIEPNVQYSSVLTDAQWQDLRNICND